MPLDPLSPEVFAFIAQADAFYAAFPSPHLGGQLFYAGELSGLARAAITAANIAGAATLAVSSDQAAAKQAMRDGIVDFLVNSLDEALRILKNEIRKRETVAVCVAAAPALVEGEMEARGVQPDLYLSNGVVSSGVGDSSRGAEGVIDSLAAAAAEDTWITLRPVQSPALWLPKLDALALAGLPPGATAARRWIERAPRYLGRIARNVRILHTTQQEKDRLVAAINGQIATGALQTAVEIDLGAWSGSGGSSGDSSSRRILDRP